MKTHRLPWIAAAAATLALCAGAASAADVSWSVGIQAPIGPGVSVGTVISNRHAAPVIVAPAPVIYAPAPVVYTPRRMVVPAPVYAPRRMVYGAPVWVAGRWVRAPQRHFDYGRFDHRGDHRAPLYVPSRQPGREIRY